MEVVYHPLVRRDVEEALSYYREISVRLAEEFYAEVRDIINRAAENPRRFHQADQGFRRANLNGRAGGLSNVQPLEARSFL